MRGRLSTHAVRQYFLALVLAEREAGDDALSNPLLLCERNPWSDA
jgi:hypothetical protein